MRFKFYKRTIGQMRYKKLIALSIFILFILLYVAINLRNEVIPVIKTICESRAEALALTVTTEVIDEHMSEFEYSNLMNLNYDTRGKLTTINANITEMNRLSTQIVKQIQARLLSLEDTVVEIPVGKLLGWSIFSGYGPKVKIKIIPAGNVSADFKTEFSSQGINQTKHTIYIEISTVITVIAPFISDDVTSKNVLTAAETVIVGDIPETYLKLDKDGSFLQNSMLD